MKKLAVHSLRFKLIAPFVVGIILLAVLSSWYTMTMVYQTVSAAMIAMADTKARETQGHLDVLYEIMLNNLYNLSNDPHITSLFIEDRELASLEQAQENWLNALAQGNDSYRDIFILNRQGICIRSTNPGYINVSFQSKKYVQLALSGMPNIAELTVGKISQQFSAVAVGPIETDDGIVGALVIQYTHPKVVDYGVLPDVDQNIFVSLLTRDGVFVAHNDPSMVGTEAPRYPELFEQLAGGGERGQAVRYMLNGKEYRGYAVLDNKTGWLVIASGLEEVVYAPSRRIGVVVLSICLIVLALITWTVVRFADEVLDTLLRLIGYAKHVSEGALDEKLGPTTRVDELGTLHEALRSVVESLQTMVSKSEAASKLKSAFLANMSHEIRTPLNAIMGMAYLALKHGDLPVKQQEYLSKIQSASNSLLGIINDILDLSKVEADMLTIEESPFDLHATLESICEMHQVNAGAKDIALDLEYVPGTARYLLGDELRVSQIFNNLVSNAIKFTEQGTVTIRCWQEHEMDPDRVEIHASVTDTGLGMPEEVLESLFQPFTQADASISRKFGGTGLGLTISDRLVKAMGGAFTVSSVPGEGSTFSFFIILKPGKAPRKKEELTPRSVQAISLAGKHILAAEDNPINQMILEDMLAETGAKVTFAAHGEEAVEIVAQISPPVDLILMDVQMPVLDGLQATVRIRKLEHATSIPIIAITANAMDEDKKQCLACGMNDFLPKPIDPDELMQILRMWLGGLRKSGK